MDVRNEILKRLLDECDGCDESVLVAESYQDGSIILDYDQSSKWLYFIEQGAVLIDYKEETEDWIVNQLGDNHAFNLVAMLASSEEGFAHFHQYQAVGEVKVYKISKDVFVNDIQAHHILAQILQSRMMLRSQRQRENLQKLRNNTVVMMGIVTILFFVLAFYEAVDWLFPNLSSIEGLQRVTTGTLILSVVPSLYVFWAARPTWRNLGVTWLNQRQAIREGVLWTLPFVALIFGYSFYKGLPLSFSPKVLGIYLVGIYFQEFFIRGLLQNYLMSLLLHPHADWFALVIANIVFTMAHFHLPPIFIICTFFIGLFWGFLMKRSRNLWAPYLSHLMIGASMVLSGFESVLHQYLVL